MTDLPPESTATDGASDKQPIRILIIEDNVADARLIREMLARAEDVRGRHGSFELKEAEYLATGLEALGEGGFDLVLLDLSLPDAQGADTFLQVQQRAVDVPVIILTGADDEAMAIRAVQGGAQDFLVKGKIDGELLWQAIHYSIERHNVQLEKRRLDARMREAQRGESLAMMAGGIAHDYNNLLTIILGNIESVLEGAPNQALARSALLDAHKATLRAAELTEHVLAYSGGMRVARRPLQLTTVLQKVLDRMRAQIPSQITLRTELPPNLPYTAADPDLLEQVFTSLIINAYEAIGDVPGEIRVTAGDTTTVQQEVPVSGTEPAPEGDFVYLEVADTGAGMDEPTRARCFDPFFTTKFTGRGLGLASAHGIVRAHRGMIQVSSEPGKGSAFRVLLPRQARPMTLMERPAPPVVALRPPPKATRGKVVRATKVLVAEDDADLLRLTKWILENHNYAVVTARDGQEAIDAFNKHMDDIAVVLLDVTMPRVDGREAMREILRLRPDSRVILCSGYSREDVSLGIEDFPHFRFLRKPYTRTQLTKMIQEAVTEYGEENR